MTKRLLNAFVFVLFALLLFACGSSIAAPGDVKIENDLISFQEVEGAVSYQVHVSGNGVDQIYEVVQGDSVYKFLTATGTYDFQVRVVGENAEMGKWSPKVSYDCSQIKLAAPANVTLTGARLTWDLVDNADSYDVIFVDASGSETIKSLNSGCILSNQNLVAGVYDVYVVAKSSDESVLSSERSAKITYTAELEQLSVPTGFMIDDGFVFFDIQGMTNTYELKFVDGDNVITRLVNGGMVELAELMLPTGTYQVSVKACGDNLFTKDSDYSSEVEYVKEVTYMTLSGKDLINAGYVKWMGRTFYNESKSVNEVYHSASGFEIFFKGSNVTATIEATNYNNANQRPYIVIVIDDDFDHAQTLALDKASTVVTLVANNDDLEEHKVDLYKRSESIDSHIAVKEIKTDGIFIQKIVQKDLKIEMIAASSSTGYGNLGNPSSGKNTGNSDALQAFAFLTARALNADINIFSASGWGCNASPWVQPNSLNVPDSYPYVDFYSTNKWMPEKYIPDIVIVNLGTNDYSYIKAASGSEYDARMAAFQSKYINFLKELHGLYPNAQIIVLYGLMGESSIYEATEQIVASARLYIPNLASIKILGDAKGYNSHPSAASHKQIAATLTEFIQQLLN